MAHGADADGTLRRFVEALTETHPPGPSRASWISALHDHATRGDFCRDDTLVERHAVAEQLHFLVDGSVRSTTDDGTDDRADGPDDATDPHVEVVTASDTPFAAVGWGGLVAPRHPVAAVAVSNGHLLSLPLASVDELSAEDPQLWAYLLDFVLRTASGAVWTARGSPQPPAPPAHGADALSAVPDITAEALAPTFDASVFASLPQECRRRLAGHSSVWWAPRGTCLIPEGQLGDGLWLLHSGRVTLTGAVLQDGTAHRMVRRAVRPGTLLAGTAITVPLPAPHTVTARRDTTMVVVPRSALVELARDRPEWAGAVCRRQLQALRTLLAAARAHRRARTTDGGVGSVRWLIGDRGPELPVTSDLYGLPSLLSDHRTRRDGFTRLYRMWLDGAAPEDTVAGLALDLLGDLERADRWWAAVLATYQAVAERPLLDPAERRRHASRSFRRALVHMPYVIKGWEHLPDDPNAIVIYNHMAYADESILPNGFLFNPDSHFVSSIIMEERYGDGVRVSRRNAPTEYWRSAYYDGLGHIPVMTPESGWRDETPEEKQRRKDAFFAACAEVLAGGHPFAIAPEGTITAEDSVTERSPGPLRPGAFIMSAKLPSRPAIVPIGLANFDKAPHEAFFSCVIKPAFTMGSRGVDVDDPSAMDDFLASYRQELRGHVEEAAALAEAVRQPGADLSGLVTNMDRVDEVARDFEPDVRALEHPVQRTSTGARTTVFYGSSTIRAWTSVAEDLDLPDAVNLGFGASTLEACVAYFDRVVLPYRPARLVVYGGDNDLGQGATPECVARAFSELADRVRATLPSARCWFLAIKPSPARRELLAAIAAANARIDAETTRRPRWRFVDWSGHLLDERGEPQRRFFGWDGLHLNAAGYDLLARRLRHELHRTGASR